MRNHTPDQMFPGLVDHCRADDTLTDPTPDEQWPGWEAAWAELRDRRARCSAAWLAATQEYKLALRLAAAGLPAPTCDADWETLAIRVRLEGERDRVRIVDHALAQAQGSVGPRRPLDERLRAAGDADPTLRALNSDELGRRFGVTGQAVRGTAVWREWQVEKEAAKRELRPPPAGRGRPR